MAMKDISDIQVLIAVMDAFNERKKGNYIFPHELLAQRTGQALKVCFRCLQRAHKQGYLEYGVSLQTASWVTEKGMSVWFTNKGQEALKAVQENSDHKK